MIICLERCANDLHMVQLMPLPPHHLCVSKIQTGLSFWYRPTQECVIFQQWQIHTDNVRLSHCQHSRCLLQTFSGLSISLCLLTNLANTAGNRSTCCLGLGTRGGQRNHVSDGGCDRTMGSGNFGGHNQAIACPLSMYSTRQCGLWMSVLCSCCCQGLTA